MKKVFFTSLFLIIPTLNLQAVISADTSERNALERYYYKRAKEIVDDFIRGLEELPPEECARNARDFLSKYAGNLKCPESSEAYMLTIEIKSLLEEYISSQEILFE